MATYHDADKMYVYRLLFAVILFYILYTMKVESHWHGLSINVERMVNMCCPQPQVVVNNLCLTFNTEAEAETAQQIFERNVGAASGYVTLQNFNASAAAASLSTDSAGTDIIATADPDNSFTVYVENITELYVFSATGDQVIGQVKLSLQEMVRP